MKNWVFVFIFSLSLSVQTNAQVELDKRDVYSLDGKVFLFKETDKPLSVTEVWEYYHEKKFTHVATINNSINIGFVKNIYWLAIPVKNISGNSQTLLTGADNGGIFRIEYYLVKNDGSIVFSKTTGTNYDFNTRAINNRHFYFPLNLEPAAEAVIFYRIDMRGNGFNIPLRLFTPAYLERSEANINIVYAFFSGLLTLVIFLSFIIFVWTKARIYLFYCLYVISYYMFFVGDGNYDVQFLYPHSAFMATISPTIYALSSFVFTLLFMIDFLQLKTTHKRLFQLSWLWILLVIVAIIMLPVVYVLSVNTTLRSIFFIYCLVAVAGTWIVQIYCIFCRIKDKFKPANLYAAALAVVIICSAIYMLHVLNIVPDLLPVFVYLPIGFGSEIMVLSFALIYSYSFYKNQHQQLSLNLSNQQLNFSRQLLQVQEIEQKRIAQDLHDELGGNLAAIKMNLQSLNLKDENAVRIIQLIDTASNNARNIAHNLMPPEFENTAMDELLQNFFNRLNREGNICFKLYTSGTNNHFTKQEELIIYRIVLELTHNIIKHAHATEGTVQLIHYDTYMEIMVEDNGTGFINLDIEGIGLQNIRSRVNFLQGNINIDSGNQGTTIMIKLPYKT